MSAVLLLLIPPTQVFLKATQGLGKMISNYKLKTLAEYVSLAQYQILKANIRRTIWQTVRRITNEILGVKGLKLMSTVKIILAFHMY